MFIHANKIDMTINKGLNMYETLIENSNLIETE